MFGGGVNSYILYIFILKLCFVYPTGKKKSQYFCNVDTPNKLFSPSLQNYIVVTITTYTNCS